MKRNKPKTPGGNAMLKDIKAILLRADSSAVEDTLGVISLFVLLFAALSVSGAA